MNRIPPQLPAHAMRTYAVDAPLSTHWRPATCDEVGCPSPQPVTDRDLTCEEAGCEMWRAGWLTIIDERDFADVIEPLEGAIAGPADVRRLREMTDLRQKQAYYIRRLSGRSFIESRDPLTGHTVFDFAPGQSCFDRHKPHRHPVRVDRPEIYRVVGGDHRGNPTGEHRVHAEPEHWVEDFAEHQERVRRQIDG